MTNSVAVKKHKNTVAKMLLIYSLVVGMVCYYLLHTGNPQMKAFSGMVFAIAIPIGIPTAKLTGGRTTGTSERTVKIMWVIVALGTIILAIFSVLFVKFSPV